MGSIQTFQPSVSPTSIIPLNYPKGPAPGKLELLWDQNSSNLYHKLSPYTTTNQNLLDGLLGNNQPFYYVYPDENNSGLNSLMKYDSRIFPIGSAPIDVIRVTKFLASGRGLAFLTKQFLLQSNNAFNETRIYNPTSPIIAAGMGLALGSARPTRFLDTTAGLAGLATSLIGDIGSTIFGAPKINPPPGTVSTALPLATLTTGGKGLLRAQTANRGLSHFKSAWSPTSNSTNTFASIVSGLATSLFQNIIPQNQNGMIARSDEGSYGIMIAGANPRFTYTGANGASFPFGQRWIAGGKVIRKDGNYTTSPYRLFVDTNSTTVQVSNSTIAQVNTIAGVGTIGYSISESTNDNKPGFRYEDNVGSKNDANFGASDIMVEYGKYSTTNAQFKTKKIDQESINSFNSELNKVLSDLKAASDGIYTINLPRNSKVMTSPNRSKNGYDQLFSTTQGQDRDKGLSAINYPLGVLSDYRNNVSVVDNSVTTNPANFSKKLSGAGNVDGINTLTVLDSNKEIPISLIKGWTTWDPYKDDQIAFYFYDVVNEKYIPFRASITGLVEGINSAWEEMAFVGRADRTYSYSGFTRTLGFSFKIVISSLAELAPTWQRINYLASLNKPSNYTSDSQNKITNRFMVPPMVMINVGDMYRDQPIIINSMNIEIPQDASWETYNEDNSQEWSYLSTYIKSPNAIYGQLPREIEISISSTLLEKERPITGGANFGHAPRTEDYKSWNTDSVPNGGTPSKLNKFMVLPKFSSNGVFDNQSPQTNNLIS